MKEKLIILMCGIALLSCRKEVLSPIGPDPVPENAAAVRAVPANGGIELKSAASAPRLVAEISGAERLVLQESVSSMDYALPTRGVPVNTLNFAGQFSDGFRAFAVYSGATDRSSDLAATFTKVPGEDVWTLVYNDIDWPLDNRLRYYFSAPVSLPSYIDIVSSADAKQTAPSMELRIGGGYPTAAADQRDLLFASEDITLVRGGTVSADVNFCHIFAGVRVRQGDTGGRFNVTGVTLTGMPTSGSCNLSITSGSKSADCAVWSHPEASPSTADFTINPADGDAIFCIPKSFSAGDGSKMKISYTIDGGTSRTEELDLGELLDGQSWLPGQMHTYTVTIADLGVVVTDVVETASNAEVSVGNTGNVAGYLRATMAADWVRDVADTGEKLIVRNCNPASEGSFTGLAKHNWLKIGDYYYYKYPVRAGAVAAETLFDRYVAGTAPSVPAYLQFRIMAQIVPFDDARASVASAWGADVAAQLSTTPESN